MVMEGEGGGGGGGAGTPFLTLSKLHLRIC